MRESLLCNILQIKKEKEIMQFADFLLFSIIESMLQMKALR